MVALVLFLLAVMLHHPATDVLPAYTQKWCTNRTLVVEVAQGMSHRTFWENHPFLVCMGADPRPKVKSERPGLVSADTIASGFGVPIVVSPQTGSKLVAGLAQCSPATVRGSKSRATPFDVNVTVCGIPPGAGSLQCTVILNGGGSGYVFWWCVSDMPPP